ncbi:16S rRNA (adenine(1518)-N(6)/adenine(1519)-N(6))-dimethyltransferase RsmA [Tepidiphilus margaritifer]|uniref:16S rRNA (adenine(1518)-N(6)/adenine(1519)-N(6))- dimethyltransferase RsmA n=1 Tax=Tepidiphilus margaritifer TaxID=203471 RepID=UPI0004131D42|nr:16S rRNA (adenine(1518)-N(6)/adenine(1519)-N(6))-dimethyltransferase RsmA [Tepidiphilus margaritifer]
MSAEVQGHRARKRFGQNFLRDPNTIRRIVAAIDPKPGEHLVEIGPGLGALTEPLIESVGQLMAIELDRDLAARLRQRFPEERLRLIEGDALRFDFASLPAPLRVVGNLPYNVSTPLLFHLAEYADRIADMTFMLQKEVVDRMAAEPGSAAYGRLSVMLQQRFAVRKCFDVPPGAFVPVPKVTSSIVRLIPLPVGTHALEDPERFSRLVAAAFNQRRKTLRNALKALIPDPALFIEAGIDPQARAETLTVEDFVRLANVLAHAPAAGQ